MDSALNIIDMILILSDRNDVHADRVENILKHKSERYFRLNLDVESLKKTKTTFDGTSWNIIQKKIAVNTDDINAVWARRVYVELLLEERAIVNSDFQIWKGEWNKTLLGIYAFLEGKNWLNFYRDSYYAENKYRQFQVAKNIGMEIPEFVSSNSKRDLKKFTKSHDEVVLKLMNQDIYKTDEGDFKGIYVNKISPGLLDKFGPTGENPVTLQEYIRKSYEVRYTVVGGDHFVCKIESQKSEISKTDWRRYDLQNTPYSKINPPLNIQNKVGEFLTFFNLRYGAFDFIVTPENKWYFLELNSMGQYLWVEDLSGLQISESIADWLISHNFKLF